MDDKIIFSIVVPIYNVQKYLNKCIDSVLCQNYRNFELILVDDGSKDHCSAICDGYAKKDSRVIVIHKKNGGLVSARNAGLKAAQGEYVLYVDGDDWLESNALKIIWEKAVSVHSPDMIIFNMTRIYSNKEEKDPCFVEEGYYDSERLEQEIYPYMMYDSRKKFYHGLLFPSSGGKAIRRRILLEHYCKEERIRMGEDNAFIFECLLYSDSAYFLTEYFYMYNQMNAGSIRHNYDKKRFDNNKVLVDYIMHHLYGINEKVDIQINVFKTYWLIMAIFHEVKCKRPLLSSAKHIKNQIEKNKTLQNINYKDLPKAAKIYMIFLRMHWYLGALFAAKAINLVRECKNR